jgi:outer membrane PBP1 activator LpoA protein
MQPIDELRVMLECNRLDQAVSQLSQGPTAIISSSSSEASLLLAQLALKQGNLEAAERRLKRVPRLLYSPYAQAAAGSSAAGLKCQAPAACC